MSPIRRFPLLSLAAIFAVAACLDGPCPDPAPDASSACSEACSVLDESPLDLPSNRCPDGEIAACEEECEARRPAGNWCAAP